MIRSENVFPKGSNDRYTVGSFSVPVFTNIIQDTWASKMKKVNKQCLLDTPRTVRFSEKNWQVIVQTSRDFSIICANKNYNSFMHMFNVSTLYLQSIKLLHQKLW